MLSNSQHTLCDYNNSTSVLTTQVDSQRDSLNPRFSTKLAEYEAWIVKSVIDENSRALSEVDRLLNKISGSTRHSEMPSNLIKQQSEKSLKGSSFLPQMSKHSSQISLSCFQPVSFTIPEEQASRESKTILEQYNKELTLLISKEKRPTTPRNRIKQINASILIQRRYRGYITRRHFSKKLQAWVRIRKEVCRLVIGWKLRKILKLKLMQDNLKVFKEAFQSYWTLSRNFATRSESVINSVLATLNSQRETIHQLIETFSNDNFWILQRFEEEKTAAQIKMSPEKEAVYILSLIHI
eukprot:TRINITY_DN439_c0_g2_i1.p1 TRINITY_DN439_c0_g2~~TRINITY_DN439_c0_g2_i1.p1  ORF type:complete len:296 (+),score=6.71 TRINITY_DN439_c0_g2_i1:66-953(+)